MNIIVVQQSTTIHAFDLNIVPFYKFHGSLWEDQKDEMGPRSPKSQDVPRYAPNLRRIIQVEADERVAQLERQLAQKEIAFAALEQESLPK